MTSSGGTTTDHHAPPTTTQATTTTPATTPATPARARTSRPPGRPTAHRRPPDRPRPFSGIVHSDAHRVSAHERRNDQIMTELNGRVVYTRDDIAARHGLAYSTLEKWERERQSTSYPQPVGTINRGKGVRPPKAWDAEEWDAWYDNWRSKPSGNRAGHPDDLITLAEAARIMHVEPTSITMYPKRPPSGWPEPAEAEELPSGRTRRRYRRGDIWEYDNNRTRHPRGS